MKKTLVFDFDGVVHSYKSGWKGPTVIPDPPVDGIKRTLEFLRQKYIIVIVSTRCCEEGGIEAIQDWLHKHEIVVDDVTDRKPPAIMYIDDRAIKFDGDCDKLIHDIAHFRVWWSKNTDNWYSKKTEDREEKDKE